MEWRILIGQIVLREICVCVNNRAKNYQILQQLMLEDLQRDIYHERERTAIMEMAAVLQQMGMLDTLETEIIMKAIRGNAI